MDTKNKKTKTTTSKSGIESTKIEIHEKADLVVDKFGHGNIDISIFKENNLGKRTLDFCVEIHKYSDGRIGVIVNQYKYNNFENPQNKMRLVLD